MKRQSITDVFDPSNLTHMQEFQTLLRSNKTKTRQFSSAFADAAFPIGWKLALLLKVIQFVIDTILKNSEPSK